MVAKRIISQKPITNAEASEYLKSIEEDFTRKEKELPFEIQQTKEYLAKLKISKKNSSKLLKELKTLKLPETVYIELVNIMPKSDEVIKAILYKKVEFTDDLVKQIKTILEKYI